MLKKWLANWLGLNDLTLTLNSVQKDVNTLDQKVGALSIESEPDLSGVEDRLDELESTVNDLDLDDYVKNDDIDDQIEQWMGNSDYCDSDRVNDLIEENTEDLSDSLEEKVAEAVEEQIGEAQKPSKEELRELIKVVLEEMLKRLSEQK
jgi:ABC-type transporter Mla subunit MlaD